MGRKWVTWYKACRRYAICRNFKWRTYGTQEMVHLSFYPYLVPTEQYE